MAPDPGKPLPLVHPVAVDTLKLRTSSVTVRAQAEQLPAIARMLDLASVEALEGRYALSRNGDRVKIEGEIEAAVHQTCIVTLEAFPVKLVVPIRLDFAPPVEEVENPRRGDAGDADNGKIDIEVKLNEDDPPEPIIDGIIDLGAVTLEFLALALDPYPRKPGASFDTSVAGDVVESPFAALAKLKRDK
ncbi:YceD family protein [Bosea lathyri]|uniref:Uncharacterized ACR, COG1399 n=1 Tax=Bosea lathyri TaxID=1036778 RepID=A0A1H6CGU9_9HYPH|nr:DUF177 domain-containing protein [Bosea lathyri]SEG72007.1 Uncharacterized ACR, COG1399 [Bosea lathyri]